MPIYIFMYVDMCLYMYIKHTYISIYIYNLSTKNLLCSIIYNIYNNNNSRIDINNLTYNVSIMNIKKYLGIFIILCFCVV